ncbi:MAG: hypothetical protein JJE13_06585 [Thermoleophilia bacterium]|nr:hypothetical protein [Thermoleophilia bacterium]
MLGIGYLISQIGGSDEKVGGNSSGNVTKKSEPSPKPDETETQNIVTAPPDEGAEAQAQEPVDLPTVPVSRRQFQAEVPKGWTPDQVDDPNSGRFTNTWISPDNDAVSVLIDSQYSDEVNPSAIDSAAQVREQTSRSEGYSETTFMETELNGYPAAKWVFTLPEDKRVDYFVYECGVGIAVLGVAPPEEFATYEGAFADIAKSLYVPCE